MITHVQALQQHRQQLAEQERYKQQLLADRQKRIQQQHEQRQKLEDVSTAYTHFTVFTQHVKVGTEVGELQRIKHFVRK